VYSVDLKFGEDELPSCCTYPGYEQFGISRKGSQDTTDEYCTIFYEKEKVCISLTIYYSTRNKYCPFIDELNYPQIL
jgi:hypothetical protein